MPARSETPSGDAAGGVVRGYGWSPEQQRRAVAFCLRNRQAYGRLGPRVFDAQLVGLAELRPVATVLYRTCAENGGQPPTPELLEELVREETARWKPAMAEGIRRELGLVLTADLSDATLVEARLVEWARTEACAQVVYRAAQLIDRQALGSGHGPEIVRMLEDALAIGKTSLSSVRLLRGQEVDEIDWDRDPLRVPTGFAPLDRAMGGGAEPGLHMLGGVPKLGKTAFLTQLSVAGCRARQVVWHVSGEVTMRRMLIRLACSMLGEPQEIVARNMRRALVRLRKAYSQTGGEILVEYMPGFTVGWMRSRLRQLQAQGLRIGLIIADFIDLMRGEVAEERRWELEHIGKDLRAMGVDEGVPVWTAKALARRAVSKAVPTEADLAECFGLVYVVDDLLVLCGTEKELGRTRLGDDGKPHPDPIIRLRYAVAREQEAGFTVGAWQRDNARQRWVHLPNYDLSKTE